MATKRSGIAAILVFINVVPAIAGLSPELPSDGIVSLATMNAAGSGGLRSPVYMADDPHHVYDMMSPSAAGPGGGPEDLRYQVTQNPASGAFCNLINLRPARRTSPKPTSRSMVGLPPRRLGFRHRFPQ
jgi:hypothetical protein